MPVETLVWTGLPVGAGQQAADFNGLTWTADSGAGYGTGSVMVKATLLNGTDVFAGQANGINGPNDAATINTGETTVSQMWAGGATGTGGISTSSLMLRNVEGDGVSAAGATKTVSLQLDFTTNNTALYSNGVQSASFWISDIDQYATANGWNDQIKITAFDTAGNPLAATDVSFAHVGANVSAGYVTDPVTGASVATLGTIPVVTGATPYQGYYGVAANSPNGAVQVIVSNPAVAVGRVVVEYDNLKTAGQFVQVSDISLTTMPAPPCFTAGTRILTENGDVAIEDLVEGDLIVTAGNGLVPVRWIGQRKVSATGDFAPIVISKGALGNNEDLAVSPAHRMVVSDARVPVLFSENEVLVAAKSLVDGDRIYRKSGGMVTYFHLLFDQHEVVFANGAAAESLYLGHSSLAAFSEDTQKEVLALFPELNGKLPAHPPLARPVLNAAEAALLRA